MKKEKLTMLYVFVLALVIMTITPGCIRKRSPQISIETYELHCRNLSDNGLIVEFYRVDMELQETLDELKLYQSKIGRTQLQQDFSGFPSRSWYQKELARSAYKAGQAFGEGIAEGRILAKIKRFRQQKAIVLTIIYQRGLTLPVSVE